MGQVAAPEQPTGAGSRSGRGARLTLVVLVVVIVIAMCGFAVARDGGSNSGQPVPGAAIGDEARRFGATEPAPSLQLVPQQATTTTTDPEPVPDALPADANAPTPEVVLGRIEIPKIGVDVDLQEGVTLTAINRGPGHWPGTPPPGGVGNMVVAGHRTTFTQPFRRIDELVPGDHVVFHTSAGTQTYEVRGTIIVPAANIGIAAQSKAHTATLFACHPLNSSTERIVVKLRLLAPDGTPVDPDALLPPVDAGSDPITDTTLRVRQSPDMAGTVTDPLSSANG